MMKNAASCKTSTTCAFSAAEAAPTEAAEAAEEVAEVGEVAEAAAAAVGVAVFGLDLSESVNRRDTHASVKNFCEPACNAYHSYPRGRGGA